MWLTHVPLTVREVLQRLVVPPILALPAGSEAQLGSEDNGNDNDHNANDNDYNGNNNNHNANDNDNKGDGGEHMDSSFACVYWSPCSWLT